MAIDAEDPEDEEDDTESSLDDGDGGEPIAIMTWNENDSSDLEQQGDSSYDGGEGGPVGAREDSCGAVLNLGGDVEHEAHQEWEIII